MTNITFLVKLKKERKIEEVECSVDICQAYITKAENCLKAARILLKEKLYENSVTDSYYAMYNACLSLLFCCGIKSENHTATILLLDIVFGLTEVHQMVLSAKRERIDKQYYIDTIENEILSEDTAQHMIQEAERVVLQLRVVEDQMTNQTIKNYQIKFRAL